MELTKKTISRDLETNFLMAISNNNNNGNINDNFSVNNLHSYDCFLSSSKGKALMGHLQCQFSVEPVEPSAKLGAGHYVGQC